MTEQEAIEYIENHGHISDDVKDMAIKALEKQMPKKRDEMMGLFGDIEYNCRVCGQLIEKNYYAYCPTCGQKLDWGE